MRPEVNSKWHQLTGYLPLTPVSFKFSKMSGFYKRNLGTDVAIDSLLNKAPSANSKGLRIMNLQQIRGIVEKQFDLLMQGKKNAQEALNAAVEEGNKVLTLVAEASEDQK